VDSYISWDTSNVQPVKVKQSLQENFILLSTPNRLKTELSIANYTQSTRNCSVFIQVTQEKEKENKNLNESVCIIYREYTLKSEFKNITEITIKEELCLKLQLFTDFIRVWKISCSITHILRKKASCHYPCQSA
jgi:hypothetical protein